MTSTGIINRRDEEHMPCVQQTSPTHHFLSMPCIQQADATKKYNDRVRTLLSGTKPEWQWDETTTCQWLCNAAFRREGPRPSTAAILLDEAVSEQIGIASSRDHRVSYIDFLQHTTSHLPKVCTCICCHLGWSPDPQPPHRACGILQFKMMRPFWNRYRVTPENLAAEHLSHRLDEYAAAATAANCLKRQIPTICFCMYPDRRD